MTPVSNSTLCFGLNDTRYGEFFCGTRACSGTILKLLDQAGVCVRAVFLAVKVVTFYRWIKRNFKEPIHVGELVDFSLASVKPCRADFDGNLGIRALSAEYAIRAARTPYQQRLLHQWWRSMQYGKPNPFLH